MGALFWGLSTCPPKCLCTSLDNGTDVTEEKQSEGNYVNTVFWNDHFDPSSPRWQPTHLAVTSPVLRRLQNA